jgi:tRNA (guanine-N7-)-methyltransferase
METHFSEGAFDTLQIFFPDPWPKKKHWKRRLIQPHTLPCMARVLKSKGRLHIATDWEPYAAHIMRVLSESPLFENPHGLLQYAPRPEARPLTKFEKRGLRYGHGVWDIEFKKC